MRYFFKNNKALRVTGVETTEKNQLDHHPATNVKLEP